MAAFDSFRAFNDSLTEEQRKQVKDLIGTETRKLLAARSEDARKRLVDKYLREIHTVLYGR
jgi:predicted Ser/Thr protein kinase